jgi:hypothetical protein
MKGLIFLFFVIFIIRAVSRVVGKARESLQQDFDLPAKGAAGRSGQGVFSGLSDKTDLEKLLRKLNIPVPAVPETKADARPEEYGMNSEALEETPGEEAEPEGESAVFLKPAGFGVEKEAQAVRDHAEKIISENILMKEAAEKKQPAGAPVSATQDILHGLDLTPGGIRRAVIMNELLSPPLSLRKREGSLYDL